MKNKLVSDVFNHSNITSLVNYNSGTVSKRFDLGIIYNGLNKGEPAFCLQLEHVQGRIIPEASEYFLGWRFNIPFLDINAKRCSFLNGVGGSFYFLNGDSGDIKLISNKLKNIKVQFLGDGNYTVTHKDGTVEIYRGGLRNVSAIIDKYGRVTQFEYYSENQVSRIFSVENDSNQISFTYNNDAVIVTEHTGDVIRPVTITTTTTETNLVVISSVSEPGDDTRKTHFTDIIDPLSGLCITSIINPIGLIVDITYKTIKYDDLTSVRVIDTIVKSGFDDDQKLIYKYSYSDNNYTGYESGILQKPGVDNCIYKSTNYVYTVTENALGVETTYVFNRFHLLIRCITKANYEQIDVSMEYNVISGDISVQPANYNLEKKITTLIGGGGSSMTIVNYKNHDDFGNLLSEISPGRRVTYEYYPKDSSHSNGCPPDPYDFFVSHIKKIITINTAVEPNKIDIKEFTYLSLDGMANHALGSYENKKVILIERYVQNSSILREYEYYGNSVNTVLLGAIKTVTNFNDMGDAIDGMPTISKLDDIITSYHYSFISGTCKTKVTEITKTPASGTKSSYIIIDGAYHLKVIEQVDANSNITTTRYNLLDQIIEVRKGYSGQDAVTEEYSYEYNFKSSLFGMKNKVTHKLPSNLILEYYYDAYNNLTHLCENNNGMSITIEAHEYNNLYLVKSTEYDSVFKQVRIETNYEHSLFGIARIYTPGGIDKTISYQFSDDFYSLKEFYNNGGMFSEAFFNQLGQLIKLQVGGVDIESYTYGDFSHEPTEINKLLYGGNIKNITDKFDRVSVVIASNRHEVESITEYKYPSPQLLSPSMVKLNGIDGETITHHVREHDAFGRVTKEGEVINNKLMWRRAMSYVVAQDEIPAKIYNRGALTKQVQLHRQHNKIREEIIYAGNGKKLRYIYGYNKNALLTASEEYVSTDDLNYSMRSKYTYDYDKRNNLFSSVFLLNGQSYNLVQYTSSSGRIYFFKNHLGYSQECNYDTWGRLVIKKYTGIDLLMSASYSANGELETLSLTTVSATGDYIEQVITFTHNELGLMTSVDTNIMLNDVTIGRVLVTLNYDHAGNITDRLIRRRDGSVISETYAYSGSSPSLLSHAKSGLIDSYKYLAPGMISEIQNSYTKRKFQAQYRYDATQNIFVDGKLSNTYTFDTMNNIRNNERYDDLYYDGDNRLISVLGVDGNNFYDYHYNPSSRVSAIYQSAGVGYVSNISYVYFGDHLIGEICGNKKSLYLNFGKLKIGRVIVGDSNKEFELFGIDPHNTVLMSFENDKNTTEVRYYRYTPHGEKQQWI